MDLPEARSDALAFIRRLSETIGEELALVETAERMSIGWVFTYNSSAYLTGGDFARQLVGQGPLIVLDDGRILEGGSGERVSDVLRRADGEAR